MINSITVDKVTCSNCKYHVDNGIHFCKVRNEECPDNSEFTCKYAVNSEFPSDVENKHKFNK